MSEVLVISGFEEVGAALSELDRKVTNRIIRKGLRDGCKVILNAARADAPSLQGIMRRNIKIRAGKTTKGKMTMTVGVNKRDFQGPTFYTAFVLFGHKVGSRKLGDSRKQVADNNFLLRAYNETRDEAADVAAGSIQDQVDHEVNS